MLDSNSKFNTFSFRIRKELSVLTAISVGVFLFVLFFQPFAINDLDFNNKLLFKAGLGAIVFLLMVLIRIVFYRTIKKFKEREHGTILLSYLSGFLIFVLSTVAFAFYLRYVGKVGITFYVVFKSALICLAPPVILSVSDAFDGLKQQSKLLMGELKTLKSQLENFEAQNENETINFYAHNSSEELNLPANDVLMIKSADNYVEIIYKEGGDIKVKLIRNTLKNIEHQLKQNASFFRCHRTCIVNILHVEKLQRESGSYWLNINFHKEQVPVSRQYLRQIKEAIPTKRGE